MHSVCIWACRIGTGMLEKIGKNLNMVIEECRGSIKGQAFGL